MTGLVQRTPPPPLVIGNVCPGLTKNFFAEGENLLNFSIISVMFWAIFGSFEHFGQESPSNDLKAQWRNSIPPMVKFNDRQMGFPPIGDLLPVVGLEGVWG
jgi:hypothetical protein